MPDISPLQQRVRLLEADLREAREERDEARKAAKQCFQAAQKYDIGANWHWGVMAEQHPWLEDDTI